MYILTIPWFRFQTCGFDDYKEKWKELLYPPRGYLTSKIALTFTYQLQLSRLKEREREKKKRD